MAENKHLEEVRLDKFMARLLITLGKKDTQAFADGR